MTTFAGFGLPVQRIGHKICIVQRLQGVHWHSHRQVCVAFARQTPPGARQINDSDRRHACNGLVTRILPRPGLFGPLQIADAHSGTPFWGMLTHLQMLLSGFQHHWPLLCHFLRPQNDHRPQRAHRRWMQLQRRRWSATLCFAN